MKDRLEAAGFPGDVHPAGNWRCRCCDAAVLIRSRDLVRLVPAGAVIFALCGECDATPQCRTDAHRKALDWPELAEGAVPS